MKTKPQAIILCSLFTGPLDKKGKDLNGLFLNVVNNTLHASSKEEVIKQVSESIASFIDSKNYSYLNINKLVSNSNIDWLNKNLLKKLSKTIEKETIGLIQNTTTKLLFIKIVDGANTCLLIFETKINIKHSAELKEVFSSIKSLIEYKYTNLIQESHNLSPSEVIESVGHVKNSSNFIQQVTDTVPSIISVYDIENLQLIYSNKDIGSSLGYNDTNAYEPNILLSILNPKDIETLNEWILQCKNAKDGEVIESEYELKHKNGKYRTINAKTTVFKRDKEGVPIQILTVANDITEKKMYEEALLDSNREYMESKERLSEAQQMAHLGSWEWNLNTNAVTWSDEMFRIFGYEPHEIPVNYNTYIDHVHKDDRQYVINRITDTSTNHEPYIFENRIITKKGIIKWIHATGKVVFIKDLKITKLAGTALDITTLKNTYTELNKTENLYKTLAKYIPDSAVMLLDEDLKISLADGSVWNEDAYPRKKIIGKHVKEVLSKNLAEEYLPKYKMVLEGESFEFETSLGDKYFKVNLLPVKNHNNQIFACLSVSHDITELKKYQKELEEKIADLNRSNKELEQFAYIASHDLQEPLRKIRAFGDRLSTKFKDQLGEDGKNYIARMDNASQRMQTLIDDLLSFSRLARNKDPFVKVSLDTLVNEILIDLEYTIEKKNARIIKRDLPEIDCAPSQMRQLFQNLISNGLKFSIPEKIPEIKISADIFYGREIEGYSQLTKNAKYAIISVSDNGIGFDEQYKEKIFNIFQRLHNRTEYEGTGIGLAVCKRIVENHNGIITANGELGKGANFIIILPIRQKIKDEPENA